MHLIPLFHCCAVSPGLVPLCTMPHVCPDSIVGAISLQKHICSRPTHQILASKKWLTRIFGEYQTTQNILIIKL